MKTYISSIGTAVPRYKSKQMDIAKFMANAHSFINGKEQKLFSLYESTHIESRYSVIGDYTSNRENYSFFPNTKDLEPFPSTEDRMNIYKREALQLSLQAIEQCTDQMSDFDLRDVTHIITISCTGMYAPGLDIELIKELNLRPNTQRTAINFMGCYAAFNGLKVADAICRADSDAKALMVAVELCTIHFQKKLTDDNLIANALFADGAATLILEGKPSQDVSLSLEKFICALDDNSEEEMAWKIGDFGFEMRLSAYVPAVIQKGIKTLTEELLKGAKEKQIDYYAIHPGGKKIVDVIERELELKPDDTYISREVLRKYGNMSSPTVLFVLQEFRDKLQAQDDQKNILSFAFGPGLTLEGAILKIHHS